MILQVYVGPRDERRLLEIAASLGRTPEDLAEAAVSESICEYDRHVRSTPETPHD